MNYTEFSEILKEVTETDELGLMTVKQVAYVMGVNDKTVYGYRSGVTQPSWDAGVRLANHLREEYGYKKLAMQTFISLILGKADGQVTDNTMKIIEACIDINRGFPDDKTACENGLGTIKEQFDILTEEVRKS